MKKEEIKEKVKSNIWILILIVILIVIIAMAHNIDALEKKSDQRIAVILICSFGIAACGYLLVTNFANKLLETCIEFILYVIAANMFILGILLTSEHYQIGIFITAILSIVVCIVLRYLFFKYGILEKTLTTLCIKIYMNSFISIGTLVYQMEKKESIYLFVAILTFGLVVIDGIELWEAVESIRKCKIDKVDLFFIRCIKTMCKYGTSEDKLLSLNMALKVPIMCKIQEFPTSSHNSDCEEKLYDKFGNCNKKEMYTYWIRKHRQCFEQICKNKNIELRDLCEMLFMLYDVITEDGVKKDSDINIRIDRDFNVQIEKLSVSNRELCDAMCSAAEEFLKEEIEIIPWNELICDNRETEDGIKISAITSRK